MVDNSFLNPEDPLPLLDDSNILDYLSTVDSKPTSPSIFQSELESSFDKFQHNLDLLYRRHNMMLGLLDSLELSSFLGEFRVKLFQKVVAQYEKPEMDPIIQMENPSVESTTLDPNGIPQPSMSPGNQEDIPNGQEPFDHSTNDQLTPTPNSSYYCQPTSTTTQNSSVFPNDAGNQGYEGVPNDQGYFDNDQLTSSSSQHLLSNQDVIDSSMTIPIDQLNLQHFLRDFEAKNQDIVSSSTTTNVKLKLEDRMGLALFAIDFLAQSHEILADPQLCCRDVFYMKVEDVRKISKQLPLPKEAQNQILLIVSDLRKKVKNRGYRQKKIGVVNEPKKNPSPIEYSKLSPAFRHQLYLWFTNNGNINKQNNTKNNTKAMELPMQNQNNTKMKCDGFFEF